MKISPALTKALNDQARLVLAAHSLGLGLSLWAKTWGWAGSHKWLGRYSLERRSHCKGILKLLADYGGQSVTLPAVPECPCSASNLPDCYAQVQAAEQALQEGWIAVSKQAEADNAYDIEEFCDYYLSEGRRSLKRLTRFQHLLASANGNVAVYFAFDGERK